jgi:hypothetical protein
MLLRLQDLRQRSSVLPQKSYRYRPLDTTLSSLSYGVLQHTLSLSNLVATSFTPDHQPDGRGAPIELEAVQFPLGWILRNASAALQYRAIIDVAGFTQDREGYRRLALGFRPALRMALEQSGDGTWGDSMLTVPSENEPSKAGTIPAFRRLLEYGWEKDSPPLIRARRVLFRLLAEDNDADQLYEFREQAGSDPDLIHRSRVILREAAAAALAHAGYERDPRLRGAALRILARVDGYLSSPLAEKPWVRVGNRQVLAAEATPPSMHVVSMIAHMPLFRSEHHSPVNRLMTYLSQPMPRQEAFQLVGTHIMEQPHLVLGDPLSSRNIADADVPFALTWLELMARLGFLRRNDGWVSLYERFLDDRDRDYVWHPHRGTVKPQTTNPDVWASFPLDEGAQGEDRWSDVTFRLGLIARLLGRPIEPV